MPSLILFDTTTSAKPLTPSSPSPCLILFLAACDSAYMALNSPSRQVNAMVRPEMAKNFNYFMANFSNYFIANASCRGYLVDKMNDLLLMLKLELVSKELNHLGTILHVFAGVWFLWSKKKCFFVIIFEKEKGNTFTLLIFFKVKSLQKEQNSTNLLLWPPICQNKSAITPKWFNSLDTNST